MLLGHPDHPSEAAAVLWRVFAMLRRLPQFPTHPLDLLGRLIE